MALNRQDRVRTGWGNFDEWLDDRTKDIADGKAEFEARAKEFYGNASRGAQQALARTTTEAAQLVDGARSKFGRGSARVAPPQRDRPRAAATNGRPAAPAARSLDQQIIENADRVVAGARTAARRVGHAYPVRKASGDIARGVGNIFGLAAGVGNAAEDMKDGAVFLSRLLDVSEPYRLPRGEAAWDDVASAVGDAVDFGKKALADPPGMKRQVVDGARAAARELDPNATAPAATLSAEIAHHFEVGKRQGESAAELASWAIGAAELKAAAKINRASKVVRTAKHVDEGFSVAKANHLADAYDGKGHHAFLKERTRLPAFLGGGKPPRWALDNPFNVLKPNGISRGEMYELHSRVDPFFYGAGFPRRLGGGGWSSKRLGIEKYSLPERLYYGTPGPTKALVGGAAVFGGGYLNEALEEGE